jgi:hypothetical protein
MKHIFIYLSGLCVLTAILYHTLASAGEKNESIAMEQQTEYQIVSDAFNVMIYAGEKELLLYKQAKNAHKPYVRELLTPGGVNVLLDSPSDHKHHHGLMFACRVDGINFWEETNQSGYEVSEDYKEVLTTDEQGRFIVRINWMNAAKNQVFMSEIRSVAAEHITSEETNLFTWQSIFSAPENKSAVTLSGAHYNGLGMRFPRSMDKDGQFVTAGNKTGEIFRGEERLITDDWCAYYSQVDGRKVTVAMLGSPENPRSPTTWFTMKVPFAYMAATMRLHEEPYILESDEPLTLTYGIALWDGHVEQQKIGETFTLWKQKIK